MSIGSTASIATRALARSAFTSAETAILATGADFPDALAAGPVAAAYDGPVILIRPGLSVDSATRQLLVDLGVSTVLIAGGIGVVSIGLERSLADVPSVEYVYRYAGNGRYETAGSLATAVHARFPPDEVYVVSGENFPDALAATWVAGATRASIFLSTPDCIPRGASSYCRPRPMSTWSAEKGCSRPQWQTSNSVRPSRRQVRWRRSCVNG